MPRAKAFDPSVALDRAVEMFWRRGYEGSSMAQLLAFMGISRQSLYDTFGDKHTLFLSAVDRYREQTRDNFRALVRDHESARSGIRACFDYVLTRVVEHPDHRSCLMANAALELGQRDPEVRQRVHQHLSDVQGVFEGALDTGRARGEFELPDGRSSEAHARFLTTVVHGLGILARGGSPEHARDTVSVALATLA